MNKAYVCLGSNMGNSEEYLDMALEALRSIPGVKGCVASSRYRTEPQGKKDQPWFLNQVVLVLCEGTNPGELLRNMLNEETRIGRTRSLTDRFGPRVIDMDLLLFDDCVINDKNLVLPHPRMGERAFVLIPLLELDPEVVMPDGTPCGKLLDNISFRLEGNEIFQ